jgi:hypothetical protein
VYYHERREFAQPEAIRFGETVDAPPRFTSVPKMKGAKQSVAGKPWIQNSTNNSSTNNSNNSSSSNSSSNNSSSAKSNSANSNSNNKSSSHGDVSARGKRKATDSSSSNGNSSSSNSGGSAAAVLTDEGQYLKTKQMEQVRLETLEAYAALKKRRRNGNTNYIAHAL